MLSLYVIGIKALLLILQIATHGALGVREPPPVCFISEEHVIGYQAHEMRKTLLCDVDNDSDNDLISYGKYIPASAGAALSWYENLGNGVFGSVAHAISGNNSVAIGFHSVVCDLVNNDTYVDVVLNMEIGGQPMLVWFPNSALVGMDQSPMYSGRFLQPLVIDDATYSADGVATADMNHDGVIDIVRASKTGLFLYTNNGTNFMKSVIASFGFITFYQPFMAALGDINGDSHLDVYFSFSQGGGWWLGYGTESFALQPAQFPGSYEQVQLIDIDLDSDLDMFIANYSGSLSWYENVDGMGAFVAHAIHSGSFAAFSFVADVMGDGDLDLVFAEYYGGEVFLMENIGVPGTMVNFSDPVVIAVGAVPRVYGGFVNGDGVRDIVVSSFWGDQSQPVLWLSYDSGFRQCYSPYECPFIDSSVITTSNLPYIYSGMLMDVFGDGGVDFVYVMYEGGYQLAYRSILKNGTLSEESDLLASPTFGTFIPTYLNEDNLGDLLFYQRVHFGNGVYETRVFVSLNLGNGTFSAITLTVTLPYSDAINIVGRLHENDVADIVATNDTSIVAVFNQGGAVFSAPTTVISGISEIVNNVVVIVPYVIFTTSNELHVYEYSTFSFVSSDISEYTFKESTIQAVDINGDTISDIVISVVDVGIVWYRNVGNGFFSEQQRVGNCTSSTTFIVDDIDGDGDADCVYADAHFTVGWFENIDGNGFFSESRTIASPCYGCVLWPNAIVDVNGDGALDVVVIERQEAVTVYFHDNSTCNNTYPSFTTTSPSLTTTPPLIWTTTTPNEAPGATTTPGAATTPSGVTPTTSSGVATTTSSGTATTTSSGAATTAAAGATTSIHTTTTLGSTSSSKLNDPTITTTTQVSSSSIVDQIGDMASIGEPLAIAAGSLGAALCCTVVLIVVVVMSRTRHKRLENDGDVALSPRPKHAIASPRRAGSPLAKLSPRSATSPRASKSRRQSRQFRRMSAKPDSLILAPQQYGAPAYGNIPQRAPGSYEALQLRNEYGHAPAAANAYGETSLAQAQAYGSPQAHAYGSTSLAEGSYGSAQTHAYGSTSLAEKTYGSPQAHAYGSTNLAEGAHTMVIDATRIPQQRQDYGAVPQQPLSYGECNAY